MANQKQLGQIPHYVSLSNELVRAAHGLTLTEKRVLMLAVSKLDNKAKSTPENLVSKITVLELVNEYGLDGKSAYKQAYDAVEHLMSRYIRFYHEGVETRMQWIGQANYRENEGLLELEFWHKLSPMLFELKNRFTSYKLNRAGVLRSVYSWRLFELIMQFKSTGLLTIMIDDFNHALETPTSLRANFANLRSRVIEPAVKEIREKDGLAIQWEAIKAGRKVKALKFTFPTEQQLMLNTNTNSKPSPKTAQRQTKSNLATPAVAKDSMAADLSDRQQHAEASGLAQLEALAKQYGIELPKLKGKRTSSTAKG